MIQLPNKELMRPKFLYPVLWKTSRVFYFSLHDKYAPPHGSHELVLDFLEVINTMIICVAPVSDC